MADSSATPPRSRSGRPTIADVAREAGVSTGAVSLAMNRRSGVAASTADRIRAVADDLGWRPSATARGLSNARAQAIGVVIRRPPEMFGTDPFFSSMIGGIESVLAPREYALVIRVVADAEQETSAYKGMVAEGRVDGVLLTDSTRSDTRYDLVVALGLPAIVVGRPRRDCEVPSVGPDERGPVLATVRHLVELGHRRIGHVRGQTDFVHTHARELAWQDGIRLAGLEPGPVADGHFTPAGGAAATRQLLAGPEPPTAIVYANDIMAIAGMSAATEQGVRVPDDLSITGFDDIDLAPHVAAPLTTVTRDVIEWGRRCATALMVILDGGTVPRHTSLPSRLVVRGSTAPPRQET
jgi:DNA-binding LacI/PurR family transcriptional regulator